MGIKSLVVEINNFDNAAMCDDPNGQAANILEQLAKRIRGGGLGSVNGLNPMDANGNRVGSVTVDFDNDDMDDDDDDDMDEFFDGDLGDDEDEFDGSSLDPDRERSAE